VVTYAADVTLNGPFKVISPVFQLVFNRMGDKARDRIGPWLGSRAAGA
jgi:hypothetical protein